MGDESCKLRDTTPVFALLLVQWGSWTEPLPRLPRYFACPAARRHERARRGTQNIWADAAGALSNARNRRSASPWSTERLAAPWEVPRG
eukprot:gene10990-biopygen3539